MRGQSTYGIYNAASGESNTWIDLITPIFEVMHSSVGVEYVDMPDDLKKSYQYDTCGNVGRLRSIGYGKKLFTLRESVIDYVCNYLMPGEKRAQDVKSASISG
jgi:ADP-L-glycero-D-manno-heptose 6-epimerase